MIRQKTTGAPTLVSQLKAPAVKGRRWDWVAPKSTSRLSTKDVDMAEVLNTELLPDVTSAKH